MRIGGANNLEKPRSLTEVNLRYGFSRACEVPSIANSCQLMSPSSLVELMLCDGRDT